MPSGDHMTASISLDDNRPLKSDVEDEDRQALMWSEVKEETLADAKLEIKEPEDDSKINEAWMQSDQFVTNGRASGERAKYGSLTQILQKFEGFRYSKLHDVLHVLLMVFTGGFSLLFARWFPITYQPFRYQRCALRDADFVRITAVLADKKPGSGDRSSDDGSGPLDDAPPPAQADTAVAKTTELLPVERIAEPHAHTIPLNQRMIVFRHQRLLFDEHTNGFYQLPYPKLERANRINKLLHGGLTTKQYRQRIQTYGQNAINVVVKSYLYLLFQEVLHPFFMFQIYSVILWCFENYYIFAGAIFVIAVVSVTMTLVETRRQLVSISKLARFECEVNVLRDGHFVRIGSSQLVPGDIVEVEDPMVLPCDMALLNGGVVVDEGMLTGESVPVLKSAVDLPNNRDSDVAVPIGMDPRCTLYAATRVVQLKAKSKRGAEAQSTIGAVGGPNSPSPVVVLPVARPKSPLPGAGPSFTSSSSSSSSSDGEVFAGSSSCSSPTNGHSSNPGHLSIKIPPHGANNVGSTAAVGTPTSSPRVQRALQGRVVGMVVRTGFATTKGALILSILFPRPSMFKFVQQSYKFVFGLFCMAVFGFGVTIYRLYTVGDASGSQIVIRALDLITIVVPPSLPLAMSVGTNFAISCLRKLKIFCIAPSRINMAGKIKLMCFDKTGTLTSDGMEMMGVRPAYKGKYKDLVTTQQRLPVETLAVMASCHTLTYLNGKLIGDPLELKIYEFTKSTLHEQVDDDQAFQINIAEVVPPSVSIDLDGPDDAVESYQRSGGGAFTHDYSYGYSSTEDEDHSSVSSSSAAPDAHIPIVARSAVSIGVRQQFEFQSQLQRMSVIAEDRATGIGFVFVKGSPEIIRSLCEPNSLPADFGQVLSTYTHQGFRVLAIAQRQLTKDEYDRFKSMDKDVVRAQAESKLQFLGLVILENKLKPETAPTLTLLRKARVRSVMVTGDNPLTAVTVAKDCGLVESDSTVFLSHLVPNGTGGKHVRFINTADEHIWLDSASLHVPPASKQLAGHLAGASGQAKYELAVTGDCFAWLFQHARQTNTNEYLHKILLGAQVFARMTPSQKADLVAEFQAMGLYVGMCGDGANDCGALKTAHVGISLSESEAYVLALCCGTSHFTMTPVEETRQSNLQRYDYDATIKIHSIIGEIGEYRRIAQQLYRLLSGFSSMLSCGPDRSALLVLCSSIAAPFTSLTPNISCIPILLCEGRSSLITCFQLFRFMAMYSMIQFTAVILLYFKGSVLGDWQYLYQDLWLVFPLVVLMGNTHASHKLTIKRPSGDLLSIANCLNVLTHVAICLGFQVLVFLLTKYQDGYEELPNEDESADIWETTSIYYFMNFQYIIMSFLFALGRPWKQPVYTNLTLTFWMILAVSCCTLMTLIPNYNVFLFDDDIDLGFRWRCTILILVCFNAITDITFELFLYPGAIKLYKFAITPPNNIGSCFGPGTPKRGGFRKAYHGLRQEFEAGWGKLKYAVSVTGEWWSSAG